MKQKKLIPLVLGCVLSAASMFFGCGLKGGPPPSDPTALQIGVCAKGYGSNFADDLVAAYNALNKGVVAEVVKKTVTPTYPETQLSLGKDKNPVVIFFTLENHVFATQSDASSKHWANLSDVYDAPIEGYTESNGEKTIEDLLDPAFVKNFTYKDGNQYSIPFTSGVVGLLYNKTKWDATNKKLAEAGQDELELPKTTNEMFTLFDRISTATVRQASGGAYAFSYSGLDSYMHFMFNTLWPQYLGATASENFYEGKDASGVYSAEIFNSEGREYAYEVVRKVILKSNGYVSETDVSKKYSQEQEGFLRGSAFFSCNGDWMEREASSKVNPGDADIVLLRMPVMSAIVNNELIKADFTGTDAEKDAKLVSIIDFIDENYIDGSGEPSEADATTLGVTLKTLEYVQHARLVRHSLPDFVAVVPEYSEQLDAAKDFLKFMYSKAGQEIVMAATYGCGAPLTIDYSQMDAYQNGTYYTKSRLDVIEKSVSYGNAQNYPMQYLGGLEVYPKDKIASAFGASGPKSAHNFMLEEYNNYKNQWSTMMGLANVSN